MVTTVGRNRLAVVNSSIRIADCSTLPTRVFVRVALHPFIAEYIREYKYTKRESLEVCRDHEEPRSLSMSRFI